MKAEQKLEEEEEEVEEQRWRAVHPTRGRIQTQSCVDCDIIRYFTLGWEAIKLHQASDPSDPTSHSHSSSLHQSVPLPLAHPAQDASFITSLTISGMALSPSLAMDMRIFNLRQSQSSTSGKKRCFQARDAADRPHDVGIQGTPQAPQAETGGTARRSRGRGARNNTPGLR